MKEFVYRAHNGQVSDVAWSPDGRRLASAGFDATVQVWNLAHAEGRRLLTYTGHIVKPGYDLATTVGWSPDGRWIASGGADGTVQVWDAMTGERRVSYRGHQDAPVQVLAWSPDPPTGGHGGARIASGDEFGRVHVWDVATQQRLATYTGHTYLVDALAWSPDGTRLATASTYPDETIQGAPTGYDSLKPLPVEPLAPMGMLPPLLEPSFPAIAPMSALPPLLPFPEPSKLDEDSEDDESSPWYDVPPLSDRSIFEIERDAQATLTAPGILHLWDAATGQAIGVYEGQPGGTIAAVAWSPDGKHIVTGGHSLDVWDAERGEMLFMYEGHSGQISRVAWSPDGRRIASASHDRTVQVWVPFAPEQRPLIYEGRDWHIGGLAWSPDGTRLAFGSEDGAVHIWEVD